MIWAVVALTIIILGLLFLIDRLIVDAGRERERHESVVKGLLDRIQFPEVRQVEPGPVAQREPPADTAELAFIGEEVPHYVKVGSED